MKLYVCWGTFWSPRPGGHPCRNAHEALREAGWDPELEKVYGSPATRWAAQFVGEVNVLSGVARGSGVETELGVFDLRAPASGSVQVAVRPEQLALRADGGGNAEVIAREFRGHDVLYRLRHEGGKTLLVQLPSLELHEVGDLVFVKPASPAAVTALVD